MIKQAINSITIIVAGKSLRGTNYSTGVVWLFADKGFKFLAELVVGFYLARYLGANQFGLLNFSISFVILFQGISTLGLNEILVRELLQNQDAKTKILSTALSMRFFAAIAFIVVIQVIALSLDPTARLLILAISVSLLFRSFEIFTPYFQSVVQAERVALSQMIVTLVGSVLKILCIILKKDLVWFAWIYSLEWLILAIALFTLYVKTTNFWQWKFELTWSRRLLKGAWYLMLSAAAVNLYMRVDQVMISHMIGTVANGQYAAAVRLSEVWYIFPTILCAIFFPAILNARNSDRTLYKNRLMMLNAFLFWFALVLALILTPLAEPLILAVYGREYLPSANILSVHIWSSIFVFLGVSSGYWLIAENMEKVSLYRTIAGLAVNLTLNYLLLPRYGAVGAAMAGLSAQVSAAIIWMLLFPATRQIVRIQAASIVYPFRIILTSIKKKHE